VHSELVHMFVDSLLSYLLERYCCLVSEASFLRDRFHLELMHENCAGDICLAVVQENSGRAEEARQSP